MFMKPEYLLYAFIAIVISFACGFIEMLSIAAVYEIIDYFNISCDVLIMIFMMILVGLPFSIMFMKYMIQRDALIYYKNNYDIITK